MRIPICYVCCLGLSWKKVFYSWKIKPQYSAPEENMNRLSHAYHDKESGVCLDLSRRFISNKSCTRHFFFNPAGYCCCLNVSPLMNLSVVQLSNSESAVYCSDTIYNERLARLIRWLKGQQILLFPRQIVLTTIEVLNPLIKRSTRVS